MLKKGCFVPESIAKTLENLIADSDLELFASTEREEFEQRLIDEVRMIAVYPVETEPAVENLSASMGRISMNLRGKFVSVTFAGRCNSASVRKHGGFVDELVDLPVGGFDFALKVGFPFWVARGRSK